MSTELQIFYINRQVDSAQNTQSNADIFKKINALLDNTLDLSSIPGLNIQPEQPKSKIVLLFIPN